MKQKCRQFFNNFDKVLQLLDYEKYFQLVSRPLGDLKEVLTHLKTEGLIERDDSGHWNITNLGAILFAKDLNDFDVHPLSAKVFG